MDLRRRYSNIINDIKNQEGIDGILLSEVLPLLEQNNAFLKINISTGFPGFCQLNMIDNIPQGLELVSLDQVRSHLEDFLDEENDVEFDDQQPIYKFDYIESGEGVFNNEYLIKEIDRIIGELESFQDTEGIDYLLNCLGISDRLKASILSLKSDFTEIDLMAFASLRVLIEDWESGDLGSADALELITDYGLDFKTKQTSVNIDLISLSWYESIPGRYWKEVFYQVVRDY